MRFVKWLFRRSFQAEYDAGYRAAVDRILLLPEKLRIGQTLDTADRDVSNCSFVGGNPAILLRGNGSRIERNHLERCEIGIRIERSDLVNP